MSNTIAQNLQRLIDAKDAIAGAITTMGGTVAVGDGLEDFATDIATIPSGGGGATILNGTSDPTSNLGNDGDVYLKTSNEVAESVTFARNVNMQLDYCCNENSVIEFDCSLPSPTNAWDTLWGSRDNTDYFIAYNGGTLRYVFGGVSGNVGDISSYYNQRIKITLSNTYCKMEAGGSEIYNVSFTGGTATATTKLGLFTLFTDNSGGDISECRSDGTLYGMKIYENDVLVRDYVPYLDGSTFCVINTLTGDIFYPLNGTLTGTTTSTGDTYNIIDSFVKVNSTWQPLIGSDIDDVNTGMGGVTSYNDLTDKPSINSVALSGNKTNDNLGIQSCIYDPVSDYVYTIVDGARVILVENAKFHELIPVMTALNQPSGLIENGNSYGGSGSIETMSPVVAFDEDLTTNVGYVNENVTDGWISYTFQNQCYVGKISAWFGNWLYDNDLTATLFVYDEDNTETELDTIHVTHIGSRGSYEKFDFNVNTNVKKLKFVFSSKVDGTNIYTHEIQAYGYELP